MKCVKLNQEQKERTDYILEFYGKEKNLTQIQCEQIAVLTDDMFNEAVKDGEAKANDNPDEFIEPAIMEFLAGRLSRNYVKNEDRKPVKRERKVDSTKGYLLSLYKDALTDKGICIAGEKTETEISFEYEGESYTVKLTKHRKKK